MKALRISDQLMVDLLVNKDRSAFAFLHDTYSPSLHGSIIELMADKDIAENVLRKALAAAYFTISQHKRGKQKIYTWLMHVALRLVLEPVQALHRWPTASQLQETSCTLCSILNAMEPVSRAVIRLIYDEGYSKAQVGCLLNLPVYRVEELLETGLQRLQQYLNDCDWKP
ncbi:hypothetical protein FAM09_07165 [Niastella caeni]|uniref:Uncharacterized protein n=1 Tax=Niastella caeni TaxID=2569763 RepID=A0A4S8I4W5_9BACT|nr:hypothetical protein [Niastella caeni]THU41872.1 hypothetical protein FAM09_07165 [Niastella caeni]